MHWNHSWSWIHWMPNFRYTFIGMISSFSQNFQLIVQRILKKVRKTYFKKILYFFLYLYSPGTQKCKSLCTLANKCISAKNNWVRRVASAALFRLLYSVIYSVCGRRWNLFLCPMTRCYECNIYFAHFFTWEEKISWPRTFLCTWYCSFS